MNMKIEVGSTGSCFEHKSKEPSAQVNPAVSSRRGISLGLATISLPGLLLAALPAQADFDIPTGSPASPLCIPAGNPNCAKAFDAKLIMFEEFGTQQMPSPNSGSSNQSGLPQPATCQSAPDGQALDDFLEAGLHPFPNRQSDRTDDDQPVALANAWESKIKDCGALAQNETSPVEGRPGGEFFAHQRWNEFFPEAYFQSAMTGARVNRGLRDDYQLHRYNKGEFGPNGLYHPANGTSAGTEIRLHPNLPVQNPNSVWTFDGTLPPKLLMARHGNTLLFRHHNALPIDVGANNGFGMHTISTHQHNGHNPAESDGYAHAFFFPGQFYDYRWPLALAGHDSINTGATDIRAGAPDGNGGINYIKGDWRETASTHWFHDHMLDHTAENVYKGNAAMMNIYSAVDRGREPKDLQEAGGDASKPGYGCHYSDPNPNNPSPNNVNLCLPSGSELDWGNRDYDMNLVVADKAWNNNGQLKFNIFNTDGFLGDRVTVNWGYKPYVDVRARRYRFRIMNGSVSRFFKIALVDETGKAVPSHMIANDGNIMEHAAAFPNAASAQRAWPEQGIGERYDMVIDFKNMVGKKLYLVNLLEHDNGRRPKEIIPLADVWSGKYKADRINGDPGVGKFLEFRVQGCGASKTEVCSDFSMNPADYVEGKKKMIPLNKATRAELQAAVHRTFEFGRSSGTDLLPWTIKTDGGGGLTADPRRVSAAPEKGKTEIWHIKGSGGWSHPVHVHFEEAQILYRGGKRPPPWEKYARKDIFRVGRLNESTTSVDIAIRFREFAGTYVEHCHNTQHEDKAQLLRWDVFNPGQTLAIPTPMPQWSGVLFDPSITLPTYKTGDVGAKRSFVLP